MVHCVLDIQVRGTVRAKYRYVVQSVPNIKYVVHTVPGTRYVVHFVADLVHLVRMVRNARYLLGFILGVRRQCHHPCLHACSCARVKVPCAVRFPDM